MKRLALVLLLLAAAFVGNARSAHAAVPCRDRIYNDWYETGKIPSNLPIACYRDAIKNVPADARVYSSLGDDIKAAMQGAIDRAHGKKNVPSEIGVGKVSLAKSGVAGASQVKLKGSKSEPVGGSGSPGTSTLASGQTSSGSGLPLPIIILGSVALALAAAGAIGAGARHFRRR